MSGGPEVDLHEGVNHSTPISDDVNKTSISEDVLQERHSGRSCDLDGQTILTLKSEHSSKLFDERSLLCSGGSSFEQKVGGK